MISKAETGLAQRRGRSMVKDDVPGVSGSGGAADTREATETLTCRTRVSKCPQTGGRARGANYHPHRQQPSSGIQVRRIATSVTLVLGDPASGATQILAHLIQHGLARPGYETQVQKT